MSSQSSPPVLAMDPMFAEGRILAGFLNEQTASVIPEFVQAPAANQKLVRDKFAAAQSSARPKAPHPRFRHVDEPEAIASLQRVSSRCGGPLALSNLVGFEWVEISGIIAGKHVAAPMPLSGRFPTANAAIVQVANYCLAGNMIVVGEDLSIVKTSDGVIVVSPEKLRLHPTPHPNLGPQGGLLVEYLLDREPSPISLLCIDDRVIAVRHLERLVTLREAGFKEALCLVHYGYGTEALELLQNVDLSAATSDCPPYIGDFSDDQLMVRVPVPTPRTLVALSQHSLNLTVFD
jgi:hypothetical protein